MRVGEIWKYKKNFLKGVQNISRKLFGMDATFTRVEILSFNDDVVKVKCLDGTSVLGSEVCVIDRNMFIAVYQKEWDK